MARVTLECYDFGYRDFLKFLRERDIKFRIVAYGKTDSVEFVGERPRLAEMMCEFWDARTHDEIEALGPIVD